MKLSTYQVALLTLVAPLLWGTTYAVTTAFLPVEYPLLIGALRALPVGLLFLLWKRELPQGIWWWRSAVLGICNIGIFFALLFVAAVRLPGGITATVNAIQPLVVLFLLWWFLREQPTLQRIGLGLLGLLGVALLVASAPTSLDPLGLVAAFVAALSVSVGTVLTKRWGRPVSLPSYTAWQLVAGGLFLLPIALVVEGVPSSFSLINLGGFFYLGAINTGLAYLIWFWGFERLPTATMPVLGLFSPITALILGFVAFNQTLVPLQVLGVLLVLSSIVLSQRPAAPAPAAPRHVFAPRP